MSFHEILMYTIAFFALIGGVDRLFGNRFGLGTGFEMGIHAFGDLFLGMAGFVCIAPVLAKILCPLITPLFSAIRADPSMFAAAILAIDMGGYSVAQEMALTAEAGRLSGILLGSMMGATVVFLIPFGLSGTQKEDHRSMSLGILCGVITIPAGILAGGLTAGFSIGMILQNLLPIGILALLLAMGLLLIPEKMVRWFGIFGKLISFIGGLSMVCAILQELTGITFLPGMTGIREAISVCGSIAIVLAGAYPMVSFLLRLLKKPLHFLGKQLGINDTSAGGLVTSIVNCIPVVGLIKDMDPKGKMINFAFMVSGAFTLGDHLGFTAGVDAEMVAPLIVGKLTAGILAVFLALLLCRMSVFSKRKQDRIAE